MLCKFTAFRDTAALSRAKGAVLIPISLTKDQRRDVEGILFHLTWTAVSKSRFHHGREKCAFLEAEANMLWMCLAVSKPL